MIFKLYTVYKKHDDDKNWPSNQKKYCKYYHKYSNNFAADCMSYGLFLQIRISLINYGKKLILLKSIRSSIGQNDI